QEIPTGKSSEEVIGAAITAGNAPCLIFNTSPASVSQFQKQGGLVPLDSFSDGTTYDDFLATLRKLVAAKAAKVAIYPAPSNEFYQSWFDFYPLYAAETGGKQLVEDGKSTFNSDEGKRVATF